MLWDIHRRLPTSIVLVPWRRSCASACGSASTAQRYNCSPMASGPATPGPAWKSRNGWTAHRGRPPGQNRRPAPADRSGPAAVGVPTANPQSTRTPSRLQHGWRSYHQAGDPDRNDTLCTRSHQLWTGSSSIASPCSLTAAARRIGLYFRAWYVRSTPAAFRSEKNVLPAPSLIIGTSMCWFAAGSRNTLMGSPPSSTMLICSSNTWRCRRP